MRSGEQSEISKASRFLEALRQFQHEVGRGKLYSDSCNADSIFESIKGIKDKTDTG